MTEQTLNMNQPGLSANSAQLAEPKVAVLAVTYRNNELVLVKRNNEPQRYGWGFPGGSVWPGESLKAAAIRELQEETSLVATAESIIDVVEVNEFDSNNTHHHFILIAILCRYVSGKAIAGDDAIDACWLNFDEIEMRGEQLIPQVAEVAHKALIFIKNNKGDK